MQDACGELTNDRVAHVSALQSSSKHQHDFLLSNNSTHSNAALGFQGIYCLSPGLISPVIGNICLERQIRLYLDYGQSGEEYRLHR